MNYTLAKELKDVGFYQNVNGDVYINGVDKRYPFSVSAKDEIVYIPTLSELIEACGGNEGENTFGLYKTKDIDQDPTFWTAELNGKQGIGTIDIIAVAKLWLALNKK